LEKEVVIFKRLLCRADEFKLKLFKERDEK
jgi:hypothetical protein